jgi:hypothetical protein
MLRTALGPAVALFLDDPEVIEVMLLADGLVDTRQRPSSNDGACIASASVQI